MKYHIQEDRFKREKNLNILMNYIQIFLTNMKEQVIKQIISTGEVLIHPQEVLQIDFFLVVVKI